MWLITNRTENMQGDHRNIVTLAKEINFMIRPNVLVNLHWGWNTFEYFFLHFQWEYMYGISEVVGQQTLMIHTTQREYGEQ